MIYENFLNEVVNFFSNNGWKLSKCDKCNRYFLTKTTSNNCGRLECGNRMMSEIKKNSKKDSKMVMAKMKYFFEERGYCEKKLPNVKNPNKDTAFVVAAVQMYNRELTSGEFIDNNKIICPQACVRLREFPKEYRTLGFIHSFVNVATLKIDATIGQYCQFLDDWVGYMSYIGVYATKIKIVFCENYVNIRDLYFGYGVDFNVDGLELGHCNFYDRVISSQGITSTGIDCGFCIERIMWLINGGSFWDLLLPGDMRGCSYMLLETEDILRTIVLVVMSGIRPGNSNERYQLKKLLNRYYDKVENTFLIDYNITTYYDYWSGFLDESISLEACKSVIYEYLRAYSMKEKIGKTSF